MLKAFVHTVLTSCGSTPLPPEPVLVLPHNNALNSPAPQVFFSIPNMSLQQCGGKNLKKYNAGDAYSFAGRCSVARPEKASLGFATRLSTITSPSCQHRSSSSSASTSASTASEDYPMALSIKSGSSASTVGAGVTLGAGRRVAERRPSKRKLVGKSEIS